MNEETFWKLIYETREESKGDSDQQSDLLVERLSACSVEDILAFDQFCNHYMDRAYRADLWDAARLIDGACSYDGFMDFRGWLIQQGKSVYEAALLNPETLAEVVEVDEDTRSGSVWGATMQAYEQKTGLDPLQIFPRRQPPRLDKSLRDEDEFATAFPRLAAKFGDDLF